MGSEPIYAEIHFRNESQLTRVTPLGSGLYRMEGSRVFGYHPRAGDVFRAEKHPDGGLRFLRIVQTSGLRMKRYFVSREIAASDRLTCFRDLVEDLGGRSELIEEFDERGETIGKPLLTIHIPPTISFREMEAQFNAMRNLSIPAVPREPKEEIFIRVTPKTGS